MLENIFSTSNIYSMILVLFTISIFVYRQVSKFKFWSDQGIKGPKPWPIFGNNIDLLLKPGLSVLNGRWKYYGPIYGIFSGSQPQLVIGDPEMLKVILVKDWFIFSDRVGHDFPDGNPVTDLALHTLTGDEWKNTRAIMSPTFTSRKMRHMFNVLNDCCSLLVENIRKRLSTNDTLTIDLRLLAGCLSMDVIAKCCFGTATNSFDDPNNVFVKHTENYFRVPVWKALFKAYTPGFIRRAIRFNQYPMKSVNFLANVSRTVLKRRLESKPMNKRDYDYLQLLIESSSGLDDEIDAEENDPVIDNEAHHGHEQDNESEASVLKVSKKRPLTSDGIIANSILFLAAGYDTTSLLISCAIYNLTIDETCQSILFDEVQDSYTENGAKFNYESISGLKYLDAVMSETLRLYPPATQIERKVGTDYTFTKNGIKVPKGGSIWIPVYNIHHDHKYWSNPETFDPSRFLPENKDNIIPYTYIPFGAGPRNCIGMRFALLEAKLAVANLILNFKFSPCHETDVPLDLTETFVLLAPKSVVVNVTKR